MSLVASLDPVTLSVEPGRDATVTVRIRNRGTIVERFEIEVVGPTAAWAVVEPPAIRLFPEEAGEARILFRPPRGPTPLAETYPVGVAIRPVGNPAATTVEEGRVTVHPFVELATQVVPQTSRGSRAGTHELTVRNLGNTAAELQVTAEQEDVRLRFGITPERLGVPAGGSDRIRVVARPKDTFLMGPSQRVPFVIRVADPLAGTRDVQATLEQRPILPGWIKYAAGLAGAGVLALAFLPTLLGGNAGGTAAASPSASASPLVTPPPTTAPSEAASEPPSVAPSGPPTPTPVPTPGPLTLAVTGDDFELGGALALKCPPDDEACRGEAERTVVSILQALLGTYGGAGLNAPDEPLKPGTLPVRASWEGGPFPYTFLEGQQQGRAQRVAIDLAPLLAEEPGYVYAVVLDFDANVPRRFVVPGGVANQLFNTLYEVPPEMPVPTPLPDPRGNITVVQPVLRSLVDWNLVFESAPTPNP